MVSSWSGRIYLNFPGTASGQDYVPEPKSIRLSAEPLMLLHWAQQNLSPFLERILPQLDTDRGRTAHAKDFQGLPQRLFVCHSNTSASVLHGRTSTQSKTRPSSAKFSTSGYSAHLDLLLHIFVEGISSKSRQAQHLPNPLLPSLFLILSQAGCLRPARSTTLVTSSAYAPLRPRPFLPPYMAYYCHTTSGGLSVIQHTSSSSSPYSAQVSRPIFIGIQEV